MASTSRPRADGDGLHADARSQDGASSHAGDGRSEDGLHADDEVASSSSDQIQAVLRILAETQRMMAQNQQGSIQKARILANVRILDFDGSETTTVRQYREWRKNVGIIKRLNILNDKELAMLLYSQVKGRAKQLIEVHQCVVERLTVRKAVRHQNSKNALSGNIIR